MDSDIGRAWAIGILRGSRKEEGRVLQGEGINGTIMLTGKKLPAQALVEGGKPSAQGVGRAYDHYFFLFGYRHVCLYVTVNIRSFCR